MTAERVRAIWELIPIRALLCLASGIAFIIEPTPLRLAGALLFAGVYMGSQIKATFAGGSIEFGGGKPEENGTVAPPIKH